ncbi:Rrf2 family transcriptional regulator [Coraliomargarita parva]|uniref:Rrf2 family transcriptional regulator n=1 Tax=Coraliomargarita parva TaxID=3014050 RepID=UPI0022B3FA3B|nr:Rrf2 family transcriptional regulator [Coraliomargarita parva]
MELTSFTDYSLRVLIYLARNREELSSIGELADYYDLSRHHLAKIVNRLAELGYIDAIRGKNGGVRLAQEPAQINIAAVIRQTEPHFNLVECMGPKGHVSKCMIHGDCKLKGALAVARGHFFAHLEQYTLADVATTSKAVSCAGG